MVRNTKLHKKAKIINLYIIRLYLKDKRNEKLAKEIIELTKQFSNISVKLNPASETEAFEKCKKIIYNECYIKVL